jgi:hypothetical protein
MWKSWLKKIQVWKIVQFLKHEFFASENIISWFLCVKENKNYHKIWSRNVKGFWIGGFKGVVIEFLKQNKIHYGALPKSLKVQKVIESWRFKLNFWSFHIMVFLNDFGWTKPWWWFIKALRFNSLKFQTLWKP